MQLIAIEAHERAQMWTKDAYQSQQKPQRQSFYL